MHAVYRYKVIARQEIAEVGVTLVAVAASLSEGSIMEWKQI